jgi:hypothetical protein
MASGFEVVKLDLAFGRDKLDDWLVAEIDREKFSRLTTFKAGKGKVQTVDAVLAAIEAAAEKRGGDGDEDEDDDGAASQPYDHFKMRILGDKLTATGRLAGDAGNEAFLLSAAAALAAEKGGKGELLLLGATGDDGAPRNVRITAGKAGWTETALTPAEAAKARG